MRTLSPKQQTDQTTKQLRLHVHVRMMAADWVVSLWKRGDMFSERLFYIII